MAEIGKNIAHAADLLRSGEIVGIPTETVYGLAGNSLDEQALVKIFDAKNRPKFDPLISHIGDKTQLSDLVRDVPDKAQILIDAFWPGPLTILLDKQNHISDLLTSGLSRMAVRIPNHPMTLKLLREIEFPLAAPSANPFGFVSPTTAEHVNDQLGNKIPYVLDGGSCEVGLESTVVGFDQDKVVIHRLGGLSVEEIEKVVGEVTLELNKSSNPDAPGQLKSHYSPGSPVIIGDITTELAKHKERKVGVISFSEDFQVPNQIILSDKGDISEAAQKIFNALRQMRKMGVELIISQKFPDEGLGRAINDRLERASVQ